MRSLFSFIIVLIAVNCSANPYNWPEIDEHNISWCIKQNGKLICSDDSKKKAAKAFCRNKGHDNFISFKDEDIKERDLIIYTEGDNWKGWLHPNKSGYIISKIKCTPRTSDTKTFNLPKIKNKIVGCCVTYKGKRRCDEVAQRNLAKKYCKRKDAKLANWVIRDLKKREAHTTYISDGKKYRWETTHSKCQMKHIICEFG